MSNDVLFKKGMEIDNRFMMVTIALDEKHIIIDAYDEKIAKRYELKIRRLNTNYIPTDSEVEKLVSKLGIKALNS